jgi:8-oxo-dGTP pyrophosphatase MutT (NUDIX family)
MKKQAPSFTHAGGIVYRIHSNQPEFLIITARKNRAHWVLPKGHIEVGETLKEAALREVKEETGVMAEIVSAIGKSQYKIDDEKITAMFFLMKEKTALPTSESEGRQIKWLPLPEALSLLSFPDAKKLLRLAIQFLEKKAHQS